MPRYPSLPVGMPVPVDLSPTCLCCPVSHEEVMRSPCATAAVPTNKSCLVRVRGGDVLIALLIWIFVPGQHLINTSNRQGGKHKSLKSFTVIFIVTQAVKLIFGAVIEATFCCSNTHHWPYIFPKRKHAVSASVDVFLQVMLAVEKGIGDWL